MHFTTIRSALRLLKCKSRLCCPRRLPRRCHNAVRLVCCTPGRPGHHWFESRCWKVGSGDAQRCKQSAKVGPPTRAEQSLPAATPRAEVQGGSGPLQVRVSRGQGGASAGWARSGPEIRDRRPSARRVRPPARFYILCMQYIFRDALTCGAAGRGSAYVCLCLCAAARARAWVYASHNVCVCARGRPTHAHA